MEKIRTRFAPSPTGFVHIGSLRTALYDHLIAKKEGGKFILRIEDTDRKRLVEGSVEKILEALDWAGIRPDEGVVEFGNGKIFQKGEFGPYVQSERLEIYQNYIHELLEKGHAYHCFCTPKRLEELRREQQKNKQASKYDKHCLSLSKKDVEKRIADGEQFVIRLNVPVGQLVEFEDGVYGKISVKSETIDDQVLIKSDGFPTYHFAVVVDDHLMKITHITRGEDWLPSTPKHILMYNYFGWDIPKMIHFPNVKGSNGKKLSKREGDVSVDDFIKKGYLPEAIVNFIVLLGWNPKSKQEYFTLEELEKIFDISGLHKAGAIFDYKKLDWMNSHYIKQKTDQEIFELTRNRLSWYCQNKKFEPNEEMLRKISVIERNRIKKLNEITEDIDFYFMINEYDPGMLSWKNNPKAETKKHLERAKTVLEKIDADDFELKNLEKIMLESAGEKRGDFLWPLRVALTGKQKSPSPFEVAWALGREESIARIGKAIKLL